MPFVIASFNITMLVFELLGFGWKNPGKSTALIEGTYYKLATFLFPLNEQLNMERAIFISHEIFSLLVMMTERKWKEIAKTYLDFPDVLQKTQNDFEVLLKQFHDVEHLFQYNKKHLF